MGLLSLIKRWRSDEAGSGTVEFVVIFPAIMFVFAVAFEAGLYMVRNAMLERAVDITVRDVRLGGDVPDLVALKKDICDEAIILKDCVNSVQIQMDPVAIKPGAIAAEDGPIKCIDKASNVDPATATTYDIGIENQLMLVRVCALQQPIFPSTGIGLKMPVDANRNYAIVATAAFVNEPGQRDLTSSGGNSSSGGTGGIGSGVGQ